MNKINNLKLSVKITPNAKINQIINFENNILKLKIKAPPVDGKANKELVKFLAKYWGIPKTSIHILKGMTSKTKILEVPDSVLNKMTQ